MKKPFIKFFDKIILLLLGLSGIVYTACEYGPPEYAMKYEVIGIVTDKETSNPIQNIQVIRPYVDTIYTSTDGKFTFYSFGYGNSHSFYLKFEDIDGEENGGDFKSKEINVEFTNTDQVEKGIFLKMVNIELEKK